MCGYPARALALALLLAALSTRADAGFTCTGWLSAVPVPGITCTNSSGQVFLKGNSHVLRLLSDDARVAGRLVAWMDAAYQPDGTAIFSGPAYAEAGTWDASGTNFTPSGGVWTISYNGVTQLDGSSKYSMTGYGMGANIEGLRLTIGGTWPSTTSSPMDSASRANPLHPWTVSAGQTIEARVDVIALSQTARSAGLAFWSSPAYHVLFGRTYIALAKEQKKNLAYFSAARASIKDTNVVLSLALTPVGKNVVLVGKVLDKDNGALIAQVIATDTPASDPTLSASQLAELTGGRVWQGLTADPVGPPHTSGSTQLIHVAQESNVAPVTAFATFDNLELRTYEVPQVAIQPPCGCPGPTPA